MRWRFPRIQSRWRPIALAVWTVGVLSGCAGTSLPEPSPELDALIARQAVYGPRSFHGTQWPDIDRFFTATPDGRALVPPVRDLVTFREHNLLARPPGETFDIVFARHVLMYLQRPQQVRVGRHLAQTLRPGGTLVLGRLETLPPPLADTFEVLNIRERIYRKRGGDPC